MYQPREAASVNVAGLGTPGVKSRHGQLISRRAWTLAQCSGRGRYSYQCGSQSVRELQNVKVSTDLDDSAGAGMEMMCAADFVTRVSV